MKLTITRLDADGRYETLIVRGDGVSFRLKGVGHNFAIPHDLAHFVVETALRLRGGFFGSIADGAVFPTMNYVAGRRKPKAAERSRTVLKDNAAALNDAEVLVGIFNVAIKQGCRANSPVLLRRLKERWIAGGQRIRTFNESEIAEVYAAHRPALQSWKRLQVGGTLELRWDIQGK